ncbi:MAG: DUF190 domain-containing protein [Spirosomataceae bacterium]
MLQAQIYFDKDELLNLRPLHEFILEFLIKQHIQGATLFKGMAGFGPNHRLKLPNALFSFDDVPMVITFIDERAKVEQTLTELRKEVKTGLIVTAEVKAW